MERELNSSSESQWRDRLASILLNLPGRSGKFLREFLSSLMGGADGDHRVLDPYQLYQRASRLVKEIPEDRVSEVLDTALKLTFKDRVALFEEKVKQTVELLRERKISSLVPIDREYPERLLDLNDPPAITYKGELSLLLKPSVGIVGTRKASRETRKMAENVARTLSSLGIVVVSGLAVGVDASAHSGAIEEPGGTIGILGCGILRDYPKANRSLRRRMELGGLVISQFQPLQEPAKWTFPLRNRVISALSDVLVVIGAPRRSGALITASASLELGRTVLAWFAPGDEHEGARELVRSGGAVPFYSVGELVETLRLEFKELLSKFEDRSPSWLIKEDIQRELLSLLSSGARHISDIVETLSESHTSSEILRTISLLVSRGLLARDLGGYIRLVEKLN